MDKVDKGQVIDTLLRLIQETGDREFQRQLVRVLEYILIGEEE